MQPVAPSYPPRIPLQAPARVVGALAGPHQRHLGGADVRVVAHDVAPDGTPMAVIEALGGERTFGGVDRVPAMALVQPDALLAREALVRAALASLGYPGGVRPPESDGQNVRRVSSLAVADALRAAYDRGVSAGLAEAQAEPLDEDDCCDECGVPLESDEGQEVTAHEPHCSLSED